MSPMPSLRSRRQAGEGRVGCILWTVAVVVFAYVTWQMVPVKMRSMDLDQFMVREAERASLKYKANEKALRKNILQEAEALRLPLDPENLEVRRTGARVTINATYTVEINFIVTTWDWVIKHSIERSLIRM